MSQNFKANSKARRYALRVSALALSASLAATSVQAQSGSEMEAMRKQLEEMQRMNAELMRRLEVLEAARSEEASAPTVAPETTIASGESNTQLSIYGQVNRALLFGANGSESEVFFVDNTASSTRFGMIGTAEIDETTVGGHIELEVRSNPSGTDPGGNRFGPSNGTFDLRERKLELFAKNKGFGDGYLGQGSTASDGAQEVSFNGTAVAGGYSAVADLGGALAFNDNDENGGRVRVTEVFNNFDGNGRQDRIRYDAPLFGGFRIGGSVADKGDVDIGAKWAGEFSDGSKAGVGGHVFFKAEEDGNRAFDTQYGVSGSYLFSSGFNVTAAAGARTGGERDDSGARKDPYYFYGSAGYTTKNISDLGETSFSLDYYYGEEIQNRDDKSQSVGLFAVQKIDRAATEIYAGFRWYDLQRTRGSNGALLQGDQTFDADSVLGLMTGARLKF